MTKDEFLALAPAERKRLASVRTLERNRSKKEGKPLPPTLGEEFGTSIKREPKAVVAKETPKAADPTQPAKPRVKPEPGEVLSVFGKVVVPAGPGDPIIRKIMGENLHCVHKADMEEYKAEAIERGFKSRLSYFDGESLEGTIYFNTLDQVRLRAILLGSRPSLKVRFGPVEAING